MPVKKLEAEIQREITEFAENLRMLPIRLSVTGRKGWPDYAYGYHGRILFVEFKRPGEAPEPLQKHVHSMLFRQGFEVFVIDNTEYGKTLIDQWRRNVDFDVDRIRPAVG